MDETDRRARLDDVNRSTWAEVAEEFAIEGWSDPGELGALPEHSCGLVVFSSNGIDAVDHEDRQRVLAGVRRVLSAGGTFVFSTLNKDNPLFGAHPGTAPVMTWVPGSLLPVDPDAVPVRVTPPTDDVSWLRPVRNGQRLRGELRDEGEWGLAAFAAHEFGLLTHFTTLRGAVAELDHHGFDVDAVFPCDSARAQTIAEPFTGMYMHLVARTRT